MDLPENTSMFPYKLCKTCHMTVPTEIDLRDKVVLEFIPEKIVSV
ncbi:hypothetical protein LCGC14_2371870 [marine sediment metagenome]|uniref:Uncharacterized protein n=1 Tax=marine sediment metagenome TaxID=412755 RepID=A0A0F9EG11_9ZZZZ